MRVTDISRRNASRRAHHGARKDAGDVLELSRARDGRRDAAVDAMGRERPWMLSLLVRALCGVEGVDDARIPQARARRRSGRRDGLYSSRSRSFAVIALAMVMVTAGLRGARALVSTGAPLAGAPNGAPETAIDVDGVPGGRCSPNDDALTLPCEPLEPSLKRNYAMFAFNVYDGTGAVCDLCGRECSFDQGSWTYCATPVWYFDLSEGSHQFRVRGIGGDDVRDATPDVYDFIVEYPLTVSWDGAYSTPTAYVGSNAALTFYLASSRPSSSYVQFEYSTTNDYIKTYTRLAQGTASVTVTPSYGSNMFSFRAVSIETFTGKTLTESSVNTIDLAYFIDDVAPAVTFTSGLADGATTSTSDLTFVLTAVDVDSVNSRSQAGLATLEVQLTKTSDGSSTPSPLQTWMTYKTFSSDTFSEAVSVAITGLNALSDSTYRLEIRVTDKAGNVGTVVYRDIVVAIASMVNAPDASALSASTTERLQTSSGTIRLASQPTDGSVVPVAYEVSAIVGGVLALDSYPTVALANGTLVSAAAALVGFRFTPNEGIYSNDEFDSQFGFDLKPATSTTDSSQVINVPAHSTITVTATNDPPSLSVAGHYKVQTIHYKDNVAANVGTSILHVLGENVIDYDLTSALRRVPFGLAIVGMDESKGTWEYSVDTGSTWTAFSTAGTPTTTNAVLIKADGAVTRVRFKPNVAVAYGSFTASFAFKGWDGTTSEVSPATGVDITTSAHTATTGSISVATATAVIEVVGLRQSLYEKSDSTATSAAELSYTTTEMSCPPTKRRAVQIPVSGSESSSSSGGGSSTTCSASESGAASKIVASSALTVSPPWTIEAWVRRDAWLSQQTLFQNKGDLSAIMLEMPNAVGNIGVVPPSGSSAAGGTFAYSAPLGEWVHLAFVMYESNYPSAYSAPAADLRLIVNGVYHSTIANTGFDMPHGIIGGSGIAGFTIDEVRFWSVARSVEEIYYNKDRFMSGTEANLVSYVPFDAGCGNSVADRDSGSSVTWTLAYHKWVDPRPFTCASISSIEPRTVPIEGDVMMTLTGERFTRPSSGWSNSVATSDGVGAYCIFGATSSTSEPLRVPATIVSDTTATCYIPQGANGLTVVQPVLCDPALGCCSGATTFVDHMVPANRAYDATYRSFGVNSPPTLESPVVTYRDASITSVTPFSLDGTLGGVLTVTGYGLSQPVDASFALRPKCVFKVRGSDLLWRTLQTTDVRVVSDGMVTCEFSALADSSNRYSIALELVYYDSSDSMKMSIKGGTLLVDSTTNTMFLTPDRPTAIVSASGGSVVSISAMYDTSSSVGTFPDFASGTVSSMDSACAFGTIRPVSARYNASETFECVAPAMAAGSSVPFYASLFASSSLSSFVQLSTAASDGLLLYAAQPMTTDVHPSAIFTFPTTMSLAMIGVNFPSSNTRCHLGLPEADRVRAATRYNDELASCDLTSLGAPGPGFIPVGIGGLDFAPLWADAAHVMVRDTDVRVSAISYAGAAGTYAGGWALTLSGSGFLPGDGCALHALAGELNTNDIPSPGHWVSSTLLKCQAPVVRESTLNWDTDAVATGGGLRAKLVARLAVHDGNTLRTIDGANTNISAPFDLFAPLSYAAILDESVLYLENEGGTVVDIEATNGAAATTTTVCRFDTIQVSASWVAQDSSSSIMRCISPSFGSGYSSSRTIRIALSQGDPGHHGEIVASTTIKMLALQELTTVSAAQTPNYISLAGDFSNVPSTELSRYRCYSVADADLTYPLTVDANNVGTCALDVSNNAARSDFAFITFTVGPIRGYTVGTVDVQVLPPPMLASVVVSAAPPPYGWRPSKIPVEISQADNSPTWRGAPNAYEGRPWTPYENEADVLPALTIFGGAWWHVSNAIGEPMHVVGSGFRAPRDAGGVVVSFKHGSVTQHASCDFVSSAVVQCEIPISIAGDHETTVRASVDGGRTWSKERVAFRVPELAYVETW